MAKAQRHEHETGAETMFRRLKSNPPLFVGTVFILVLVIVSFVLVPAIPELAGGGNSGAGLVFGSYDDIQISYSPGNYFGRALDNAEQMENFRVSGNSDDYGDKAMRVWQTAFYSTLVHVAVLDEMKRAGYAAPEQEIDKELSKLSIFQDNGKFSVTKYRNYNKNLLPALRRSTEEDYTERQFKTAFTALLVPEAEKTFVSAMSSPERNFVMASFPRSSYPDSEVAAYAAANPAHFEMVHFFKITVESGEKEALQILEAVKSGKTNFEDAARNQSKTQNWDLGLRMAYELYTALPDETQRAAVLALKPGELSGVVKDPAGWAFYRAEAPSYKADLSVQENLNKARSYMTEQAGGYIENWLAARAEEFISRVKASDFEMAAAEAELEVKRFGPVSLNYGNVSLFTSLDTSGVPELQAALRNENFWRIAFTTPLKVPSAPFTLGTDIIVLEAEEEKIKDDTEKGYISEFFANGYWLQGAAESGLGEAVSGSEKTKDNFFMTYITKIMSLNQQGDSAPQ